MTHDPFMFNCKGQELTLLSEKAIFWASENTLIISDLHLGKAGHFRKHGIPIPTTIHLEDLDRLTLLIKEYRPDRILCLGDLFHSDYNEEWIDFRQWLLLYDDIDFVLVRGNHDILDPLVYEETRMKIFDKLEIGPFLFTHEEEIDTPLYSISGHVHPCIRVRGSAKQSLTLPCYYFSPRKALLPAFGNFTGTYPIRPTKNDDVFGIVENRVVSLVSQKNVIFS